MRETRSVETPFSEKFSKSKEFAYLSAPDHVFNELQQLLGIEVWGNKHLIKESTSRKRSNPVKAEILNTSDSQNLVNKFPEKQNASLKPSVVPGNL